jgi:hypothetical protein
MTVSNFLANKILDHILGRTTYTPPSNLYLELYTAAPTEAGGGTPVSAGGYARATVANDTTQFPNASARAKSTSAAVTFPYASASWGTIVSVGIFDASTGGNLLFFANLSTARTVDTDSTLNFAPGQLSWNVA